MTNIPFTTPDPVAVGDDLRHQLPRKQLILLDKYLQELRFGSLTRPKMNAQQQQELDQRLLTAHHTVNLLRHLIGSVNWNTAADLLSLLRLLGREMQMAAGPREPAVPNIVRRVMAAVREEAMREAQEDANLKDSNHINASTMELGLDNTGRLSLQTMLWALPQHVRSTSTRTPSAAMRSDVQRQESLASEMELQDDFPTSYYAIRPNLKQAVLEAIQEIITDLEDLHRNINEQVSNHIHSGEVILTCGDSRTVESFLKAAVAKNQKFTVIVCGNQSGRKMASRLARAGIETILLEIAAVFAILPRVHKVLLPAHAVLANGGLVAHSGCNLVALAAHHGSVPVVCVTGLFKLCPMYPHEGQDTLQDLLSPVPDVVPTYSELHAFDNVELVNPMHDYIEPKLVNLYITNVGAFQPSFVYRILAENYHSDDWESF